jgi:hypothetical protein
MPLRVAILETVEPLVASKQITEQGFNFFLIPNIISLIRGNFDNAAARGQNGGNATLVVAGQL